MKLKNRELADTLERYYESYFWVKKRIIEIGNDDKKLLIYKLIIRWRDKSEFFDIGG